MPPQARARQTAGRVKEVVTQKVEGAKDAVVQRVEQGKERALKWSEEMVAKKVEGAVSARRVRGCACRGGGAEGGLDRLRRRSATRRSIFARGESSSAWRRTRASRAARPTPSHAWWTRYACPRPARLSRARGAPCAAATRGLAAGTSASIGASEGVGNRRQDLTSENSFQSIAILLDSGA